jgi:hypothetical protein
MIDAADLAELRERFVPCSIEDARREAARMPTAVQLVDAWFALAAAVPGFWLAALSNAHENVRREIRRTAGRDRGCTGPAC